MQPQHIRLSADYQKQLISRGMPRDVLRNRPFELNSHVTTLVSEVEGLKRRRVLKSSQLDHFTNVCQKPFSSPYLYIIGSQPNDGKAKQVAAFIMELATKGQLQGKHTRSTRGRQLPLWHMMTGGWHDRLRDGADDQPSLLILSNVTVTSTNAKLEKLRDLLEMYNHIPRVVVMTGEDPMSFANTKLFLPVNHVLNISTARKVSL